MVLVLVVERLVEDMVTDEPDDEEVVVLVVVSPPVVPVSVSVTTCAGAR
jgi:hypothetical protein